MQHFKKSVVQAITIFFIVIVMVLKVTANHRNSITEVFLLYYQLHYVTDASTLATGTLVRLAKIIK